MPTITYTDRASLKDASDPVLSHAARVLSSYGASKGGFTRAANLSPVERSAIASKASRARWGARSPLPLGGDITRWLPRIHLILREAQCPLTVRQLRIRCGYQAITHAQRQSFNVILVEYTNTGYLQRIARGMYALPENWEER